ncbi:Nucleoporin nup85 [Actinomortierella wolfii]|nr:Nucleoporin nup85 [Actinomortierella wolfii]
MSSFKFMPTSKGFSFQQDTSTTPVSPLFRGPTPLIKELGTTKKQEKTSTGEDKVHTLYLYPSSKNTPKWPVPNRTLGTTFRPSTNEVAVYVAGKKAAEEIPERQKVSEFERSVYLCQASIPAYRIPFIQGTFTTFSKITRLDPYSATAKYMSLYEEYRNAVGRYRMQLAENSLSADKDDAEAIIDEMQIMEAVGSILELSEYVFFTSDKQAHISFQYSHWLNSTQQAPPEEVTSQILDSANTLQHPQFWPCVLQCILRGLKHTVIFLVKSALQDTHQSSVKSALNIFLELLEGLPTNDSIEDDNKNLAGYVKWQERCEASANGSMLNALGEKAKLALRIMSGDAQAILNEADTWQEAFGALLLFVNIRATRQTLGTHLDQCRAHFSLSDSKLSLPAQITLAILDLDASKVVRLCGNLLPWLAAHLSDVLHQFGYLELPGTDMDMEQLGYDREIHEFYLENYAQTLMADPSLWEAVAGYLLGCGRRGAQMLTEWICHLPQLSEKDTSKVLAFCERHGLQDAVKSIYRVLAVDEEQHGRYALSIAHFLASGEPQRAGRVIDQVLSRYLSGNLSFKDLCASVPNQQHHASVSTSQYVTFMRAFTRYHQELQDNDTGKAAKSLMWLLSTGRAPAKYWLTLLAAGLPLFEQDTPVLDANDTYELMRCLDEIVQSQHRDENVRLLPVSALLPPAQRESREEILITIRYALTRNLARAIAMPPAKRMRLL